jgi:hypothetical protein
MDYVTPPGLEPNPEIMQNFSNRFRTFLSAQSSLSVREPGTTIDLKGGTEYLFPYSAINWDTVVILGQTGDFTRKVFSGNSWQPRLVFKEPQTKPIQLNPYSRFSSFVLTTLEDFPGDFEASLQVKEPEEEQDALDQSQSTDEEFFPSPVVIPIIDMTHGSVRNDGEKDIYTLSGTLACYAPSTDKGFSRLQKEVETLNAVLTKESQSLRRYGILQIAITSKDINTFKSYTEGSIIFDAEIALDLQEDRYWKMPY